MTIRGRVSSLVPLLVLRLRRTDAMLAELSVEGAAGVEGLPPAQEPAPAPPTVAVEEEEELLEESGGDEDDLGVVRGAGSGQGDALEAIRRVTLWSETFFRERIGGLFRRPRFR